MASIRAGLLELKAMCVGTPRSIIGNVRSARGNRTLPICTPHSAISTVTVLSLLTVVPAARASAQAVSVVQTPGAAAQAPPRDNVPKTGTAILRGRVVAADSGMPLRKAIVRIFAAELGQNRMTTTDPQGRYEFKELPAGRYSISASKGSFVGLSYGQTRPFAPGKPLEIHDAQTVEKVDFSLPRGGVITGRILDEFGEPISDVQVMAQQYRYMQGRRRLMPTGRAIMTNDIGEFRVYGLSPGQYYLSATLRNFQMGDSDDRSGYAPTYYPGTPNPDTAQKITLEVGQTVSDLVMALMPARTSRVSGTAADSQGRPLAGMVMLVQRSGGMFMMSSGGQIKSDGTFSIGGVAPGDYTLQSAQGDGGEVAVADITVNGDDLTDVRLVATRPVTVSGRVVVDAAAKSSLRPSMYKVVVGPVRQDAMMPGAMQAPATLNDDLTFSTKARPGLMRIGLVSSMPGASGTVFTQRAIRLNDVDVIDTGIEIKPGQDIEGLEIELTNHISDVSGVVTNARGETLKEYTVVVFPRDREKWTANGSRYVKTGRPDQDGRFKIQALPPGDYDAVALDDVEPGESSDPEFLERIRSKATPFSVNEGETKTLDLKLSASS